MNKRLELLQKLKSNLPEYLYNMVCKIIDLEDKSTSKIDELIRLAETNCLTNYDFDASDWLPARELVEYMELDNIDRVKFGMEAEWDLKFIESVRRQIK